MSGENRKERTTVKQICLQMPGEAQIHLPSSQSGCTSRFHADQPFTQLQFDFLHFVSFAEETCRRLSYSSGICNKVSGFEWSSLAAAFGIPSTEAA